MKVALPLTWATPRPSCARESMAARKASVGRVLRLRRDMDIDHSELKARHIDEDRRRATKIYLANTTECDLETTYRGHRKKCDVVKQDTYAEKLERRAAWTISAPRPSLPRAQKRLEVFASVGGEAAAYLCVFVLFSFLFVVTAHQFEAQIDEIGVQHVGRAGV